MKIKNLFLAVVMLGATFTSCSDDNNDNLDNTSPLAILDVSAEGSSKFSINNIHPVLSVTGDLTSNEAEFVYALREDEKLAHDILTTFASNYPTAVFTRMISAELSHRVAFETLLDYYEIEYPAVGEVGVFADALRQGKYNQLVAQGTTLAEAYKAIASLEEENIVAFKADLQTVTNENILLIINNMLRACENHLRAYVREINLLGETYVPTYMAQSDFDTIVNSNFVPGEHHNQHQGQGTHHTNSGKGNHHQGNKGYINNSGHCNNTATGNNTGGGNTNTGNNSGGHHGGKHH